MSTSPNVYTAAWMCTDNHLMELKDALRAVQVACDIVRDERAAQTHGATAALFNRQRDLRREVQVWLRDWYMLKLLEQVDTEQVLVRDKDKPETYAVKKLTRVAEATGANGLPDVVKKAKAIRAECEKFNNEHRAGTVKSLKFLWEEALDALVEAEIRFAPMWSQLEPSVAVVVARMQQAGDNQEVIDKEFEKLALDEEDDKH